MYIDYTSLYYWLCLDKLLKIVDIKCECNALRMYTRNNNFLAAGIAQIGNACIIWKSNNV